MKLDEPKRKEIIEKMAEEYFGNGVKANQDDEAGQTLKEVSLRGDQMLKILEQVAAAVRGK